MLVDLQELRPIQVEHAHELSASLVQRRGSLISMLDGSYELETKGMRSVQLEEGVERSIDKTFIRTNIVNTQASTKMVAPDKVGVRVRPGYRISK